LPRDTCAKRFLHALRDSSELVRRELTGRPKRMDLRAPERLVGIDVSHPGKRALVQKRCLDGSAAAGKPICEPSSGESALERLAAEAFRQVRLELVGLHDEPGAEPANVAIRDVRPVV
jgi:hypothetical protein